MSREKGVDYYFRVAAANALGYGAAALAPRGFAAPEPISSDPPVNAALDPVDGTTLRVGFWPPAGTGGLQVGKIKRTKILLFCVGPVSFF